MTAKIKELKQTDVLRMEAEINNLWGELNTSTIPHVKRTELEQALAGCEEEFKVVLGGQASISKLENTVRAIEMKLTLAIIQQAENEIPKAEHNLSPYQALENIRKELNGGRITPVRARHGVKEIIRNQS